MTRPVVLKFGGELLEDPERLRRVVAPFATGSRPLAIVMAAAEIDAREGGDRKRQVKGCASTTDAGVVVSVLAERSIPVRAA